MTYLAPRLDAGITPTGHVVHLTDDLWSYPWYRPEYDEFLRQELARCQMAIGSTPALVERLATYGIETHHLPHGVDIELFGPVADGKVPPPNELVNRPRPRLGLVGNIEDRIDVDLVEALAMGSGSVTLVGPVNLPSVVRQRLDRAGCFFAGPVPYHDVPKWLAGLDVALVPYRTTELIRRSRPLKLLDYLAAGRPVVSTDMPAARELEPHVTVASSRSEYVDAVEDIWRRRDVELELEARRRRRDAVAKESWTQRGEELEALFERALQLAPR
jgi:teichuronic acid biosynthesis glycosyltransferase TuaH